MFEFSQKIVELTSLLWFERCKQPRDVLFLLRHGFRTNTMTLRGQKQEIAAAVGGGSPLDPAVGLHSVQQLTDVSLRDQQPVCELLLSAALSGSDLREHIELRDREPLSAKRVRRPP